MKNNNELIETLASTIGAVKSRRIDPKIAREVSSLSRTTMGACRTQIEYNSLVLKTPGIKRIKFLEC